MRQLHRRFGSDLEYTSAQDDVAPDLNCGVHRSRALNVHDMKIHRVAATTRDHIEAVGQGTHYDRVTADVVEIPLHRVGYRMEISADIALRRRNDHRIVLP